MTQSSSLDRKKPARTGMYCILGAIAFIAGCAIVLAVIASGAELYLRMYVPPWFR